MSNTLDRWNRYPARRRIGLPKDPLKRDKFIVQTVGLWARGADDRLNAALAAWQAATGQERDLCRFLLRRAVREYRDAKALSRETFSAYCRDVHERLAAREAA